MNVAAVMGSPHRMKGNTGQLLGTLLRSVESAGARVSSFLIADLKVAPCRGCDACHKTGECAIKDDFQGIRDAILAADGVVLASPNYIFSVTAQMKAFLDRCCCPIHCAAFRGKYGAAVVTSGGPGSNAVEEYILRFLRATGCWTVGTVGTDAHALAVEPTRGQALASAATLGARLVEAIRAKKSFPDQEEEQRAFLERMKQLVTLRKEDWPYEYKYWKSLGRL